ncbi:MAG: lipid A export permease/ATP-binding protein MsbA [Betaproteobacteria bacterium]
MSHRKSSDLYFRLLGYLKPYWIAFAISIVAMVLAALSEVALPVLIKPFLDGTFIEKDPVLMTWTPVFLVGIFLARGITGFVAQYMSSWVGNKMVFDLREQMFEKLLKLPLGYFHENSSGSHISKFTFDVAQVQYAATQVIIISVKDTLTVIGLLGYLVYLDWRLTCIALVMLPPIALVVKYFNRRLRWATRETQDAMGAVTEVVQESIDCSKVVKIYEGVAVEKNRFADVSNRLRRLLMKQTIAVAANVPIVQLIASVATAIVIFYILGQVRADATTIGGFVSYLAALLMLTAPIKRITGMMEHLQRGLAACESVFGLIDEPAERDSGTRELRSVQGRIVFDNVCFKYDKTDQFVLKNINLTIEPGESVAIVGASGSGKTTLVNLIPRFFAPSSGTVTVDGNDLSTLTLTSLRGQIALVSQEIALFNYSVAANVAYGAGGVQGEALDAALRDASATGFVDQLPGEQAFLVGEKGMKLSGGQRQRIAIARALYKDAPIVIMDEATSALDSESEKSIQGAFDALRAGRTTITIAHRLSTIEQADKIVVMDGGEIIEIGKHQELLSREGVYAKLHSLQSTS